MTFTVWRQRTKGMATRKTGSRRIVVDGVAYRWRIRQRETYSQTGYGCGKVHLTVELAEQPGAILMLYTDRPHPADWGTKVVVPVLPSDVAGWVREALAAGWTPAQPGSEFAHRPVNHDC